jgi:hypothetical protein
VAAAASQSAVLPNHHRSGKASGPEPTVPMPLRRAPAGRRRPGIAPRRAPAGRRRPGIAPRRAPAGRRRPGIAPRRAPAGRRRPGIAPRDIGHPMRMCDPSVRGSAPSTGVPFFPLQPSWLRSALRAIPTRPPSAVLQPLLPSGVASGHRARTTLAAPRTPGARTTPRASFLRTVRWLANNRIGHTLG